VCKETAAKQALLYPKFRIAKKIDNQARITGDKLLFRGRWYTSKEVDAICLEPHDSCRRGNGVTLFAGEDAPLSNLYPCHLDVNGVHYISNEHHYQSRKCEENDRGDLAQEILTVKTAREAMRIGRHVRANLQWYNTRGRSIMQEGLEAKFTDPRLRDHLLSTVGIIGEATPHEIWGIGHRIDSNQAWYIERWEGSNWMGELLTELRDNIMEEQKMD
jgi:hypothetical protein